MVNFCVTTQDPDGYDKTFAGNFKKFLSGEPISTANEDDDYMWYIEDHLEKKECPSFCTELW